MAFKPYPLQVCIISLFLLLSAVYPVRGYIGITLRQSLNSSAKFERYSSYFADARYSSAAKGKWYGYLLQVHPDTGCPGGTPHPEVSDSYIAVFKQYPYCYDEAVLAVRQAGFELILIGDYMNMNFSGIGNPKFPVAIISEQYANYLVDTVLSDVTYPDILASIDINLDALTAITGVVGVVGIVLISFLFMLLPIACVRIKYCLGRRNYPRSARRVRFSRRPAGTGVTIRSRLTSRFDLTSRSDFTFRSNLTSRSDLTSSLMLPLGSEQIKKMPSKSYERALSVENCGICLEELNTGDKIRDLPCGHNFHVACLDDWLKRGNRSCPICRHNVTRDMANNRQHQGISNTSSSSSRQNYHTLGDNR